MPETIWIPITEADVQGQLLNVQLAALRTAALAPGQTDPLTSAIAKVTRTVRLAVESCPSYAVSSVENTIPPCLLAEACWLVIELVQTRVAVLRLTEDQVRQIEAARGLLMKVAGCKWAVEKPGSPLSPASAQRGGGASVVAVDETVRTATRGQMDGL